MIKITKVLCIKDIPNPWNKHTNYLDKDSVYDHWVNEEYGTLFFQKYNGSISYFETNLYIVSNIKEHIISMAEWREQQINSILDGI